MAMVQSHSAVFFSGMPCKGHEPRRTTTRPGRDAALPFPVYSCGEVTKSEIILVIYLFTYPAETVVG